jgi:hypothetical protein
MSAVHPFTRAGFGPAPFRCIGVRENRFEMPGGRWKPGGNCHYCSTGILYEYVIRNAAGREFIVGSDCVKKTHAEVEGFREQRLQLNRTKRERLTAARRAERQARWEATRVERLAVFRADPANAEILAWLGVEDQEHSFRSSIRAGLERYGDLTERQREAVMQAIAREAAAARRRASSAWIGEIGRKLEGEFVITLVRSWESNFGWPRKTVYLSVLQQGDNVLVYKGNPLGEAGTKFRGTFTVKEHGERDGVKQTILQRPRNIEVMS